MRTTISRLVSTSGIVLLLVALPPAPALGHDAAASEAPFQEAASGTEAQADEPAAPPPLPRCRVADELTRFADPHDWRLTRLDLAARLPRSYRPARLVPVSEAGLDGGHRVRRAVIADLRALGATAEAKGHALRVVAGFRSADRQRRLFRETAERVGYRHALPIVARPGHSEHQLGTAVDLEGALGWLARKAWRFGFVQSYPPGERPETCYRRSAGHFRYVGRPLAAAVRESGLTLRRYLWERIEHGGRPGTFSPLPACRYDDVRTRYDRPPYWRITLLDTIFRVGRSYVPTSLEPVSDASLRGSYLVRNVVIADLRAMARAARAADAGLAVVSAYRSYARQQEVFQGWVDRYGYERALRSSARPGHSEHQLGTAIDFRSASSPRPPWDYDDWATTRAGGWLKQNAWRYGFVMSDPRGASNETCYSYEPWHYRYVGRQMAASVRSSGATLRRYLWEHYESAP